MTSGQRTGAQISSDAEDQGQSDAPSVNAYQLDAGQSKFTVQAIATGLLAGFGHNPVIAIRGFTGLARFVPGTFAEASLRIEVDVSSFAVIGDIKAKDRQDIERTMFNDVLEINRFPEIVYQSNNVAATRILGNRYKARLTGELYLHGVKRPAPWIQSQFTFDESTIRATGEFTLRQSEFGIKPVTIAIGALKLKDELRFSFELVGRAAG